MVDATGVIDLAEMKTQDEHFYIEQPVLRSDCRICPASIRAAGHIPDASRARWGGTGTVHNREFITAFQRCFMSNRIYRRPFAPLPALMIVLLAACPAGALAQTYTQQAKLVASDSAGYGLGYSVSLSADGNTALLGAPQRCDDSGNPSSSVGAAWIFARSNGQWVQQGAKLVGSNAQGGVDQGYSVALSADGNTALVGGPADVHGTGAVWVFVRNGGGWIQQGDKLVRPPISDDNKYGHFGMSVSVSADGNTAIIGDGYLRSGELQDGGAWIFVRSSGVWAPQGGKLLGTGAVSSPMGVVRQGSAVAISADGNTAMMGGPWDNNGKGAAWVFARNGTSWVQQGGKLTGPSENTQNPFFASAIALSGDGNTALVSGLSPAPAMGAIFVRTNATWSQRQTIDRGFAVGLSRDGSTAIIGDDRYVAGRNGGVVPAGWVSLYSRNGDQTWSRLGNLPEHGDGTQGHAVALSANGGTAISGAPCYHNNDGAAWIFTKPSPLPAVSLKFNGQKDGSGSYARVADATDLRVGSQVTLEAMVYWDGSPGYLGLVSKPMRDITGPGFPYIPVTGYALALDDGKPMLGIAVSDPGNRAGARASAAIPANVWTAVSATYDGRRSTTYVNGVEVGRQEWPDSQGIADGPTPVLIGREFLKGFLDRAYGGRLADVRIWNQALPPETIAAWSGKSSLDGHPNAGALVARWLLNEGDGAVARDSSGHHHDAMLANGATWWK
ncbi:LamG-like jellyroll fold domain-containing protein [Bradyrhizobium sp. OK095]|uniref:LamG-like jellyroll fold domain-containing protein n=1 Tax=Bradyrhizobium sp. OK095 TaxID=1882760 RepID=UPI000B838DFB|nr:LamG-like jellyroll fold domain-containing protein [Bradyrhizobium sp. OK095]